MDDARVHNVKVNRLHLNKSDTNFNIIDKYGERNMPASDGDEIYYGFSKIKGIGDEPAQRIVDLQPYEGFVDFLEKFGTDAKVVQALIALRVFNEADPITLWKFYETFKKKKKKEEDRGRRNVKSVTKYKDQLKEMCPDLDWLTFDEVDFSKARPYVDVAKWKEMTALKKKYDRCVATFATKTQEAEESNEVLTLENFNAAEAEIDPETEMMLKDQAECEIAYYGFEWEQTGGTSRTISSVALFNSATQIKVTLSGDPGSPSLQRLHYADQDLYPADGGPTTGPRGNVRDSDPMASLHGYDLFNWCVHFVEAVT
jgi:DNA polymerase III alpha subunit